MHETRPSLRLADRGAGHGSGSAGTNGEARRGDRARPPGCQCVLSAEEEGRLVCGSLSTFPAPPASIAVCDVGGGSTQLVFGTARAVWFGRSTSVRCGPRRGTFAHDPPRTEEPTSSGRASSARSRATLHRFRAARSPRAGRPALRRGWTDARPEVLARPGRAQLGAGRGLAEEFGFPALAGSDPPAGALVLAEAQKRLGVPLVVARVQACAKAPPRVAGRERGRLETAPPRWKA
jgi:hypothetical protein